MRRGALFALLLVSCVSQVPLKPLLTHEAVAVGELARWEAAHGPLPRCRAELVSLRWETKPIAVLSERCGNPSALAGCFSYEGPEPRTPTITLAEDGALRTDEQHYRLWRHELTHFLLQCSGIDPTGDPEHAGPWWAGL